MSGWIRDIRVFIQAEVGDVFKLQVVLLFNVNNFITYLMQICRQKPFTEHN